MSEATRLCLEAEKHVQQTKSANFDLQVDPSNLITNNDHKPVLGNEENGINNKIKSEEEVDSMDKDAPCPLSESVDDSLITLDSYDSEFEENSAEKKDKEITEKNDDEEEETYEELICLVRQFYVEKPINPAALAHQNIETC